MEDLKINIRLNESHEELLWIVEKLSTIFAGKA